MADVGTSLNFEVQRVRAGNVDTAAVAAIWLESAEMLAKADKRYQIALDGKARWESTLQGWLADDQCAVFVAVRADKPVGYIVGSLADNLPGFAPARFGMVEDLAIDAHAKTGRIGREMFAALREWFRAQGVDHIESRVPAQHPIAQAFWRALGATRRFEQMWLKLK